VFRTIIPRNVRLAEAPSYGVPVMLHDKDSRGALAYFALANEMMGVEPEVAVEAVVETTGPVPYVGRAPQPEAAQDHAPTQAGEEAASADEAGQEDASEDAHEESHEAPPNEEREAEREEGVRLHKGDVHL
jgi:hypothetical protein